MSRAATIPVSRKVSIDLDTTDYESAEGRIEGTSADPLPEDLIPLNLSFLYTALSHKVRDAIKAEARRVQREVRYSVSVDIARNDPEYRPGAFLVATITFDTRRRASRC